MRARPSSPARPDRPAAGRRRVVAAAATVLGTAALALATGGSPAVAATPPATTGATYVALGDSYAAGYGLPRPPSTLTAQPVPGCLQSDQDYPHRLAAALGLTLTDVTCSGARTTDFAASQDVSHAAIGTTPVTGPNPAPQYDAVAAAQPDLVTITIGGNDLGFSAIAQTCYSTSPTGPLAFHSAFASCQAYFASLPAEQRPENAVAAVAAAVGATVAHVHQISPRSRIAVIAYPTIAPAADDPLATAACYPHLAFATADYGYLEGVQRSLDAAIGTAVTAAGAGYADIHAASLAHSACAPSAATSPPDGVRWVAGFDVDAGGFNLLHPTLLGTQAMTDALAPAVAALFAADPLPTTTPTPTPTPTPTTSSSAPAPTTAPTSADATGVAGEAAGGATLAATGPRPVAPLVTGGVLALAAGAGLVLAGTRPARRRATHRR